MNAQARQQQQSDTERVLLSLVNEASRMGRLVAAELEISCQCGRVSHVRDSWDEFVPANTGTAAITLAALRAKVAEAAAMAASDRLYGTVRIQFAVSGVDANGEPVLMGCRCRRERVYKVVPAT